MKEQRFCPHCGAEVQFEGQECCWECGKPFDEKPVEKPAEKPVEKPADKPAEKPAESVKTVEEPAKAAPAPVTSQPASKPAGNNKVLIGVLAGLVVALTIGLVFALGGKEDDEGYDAAVTVEYDEDEHIEEDEFQPDDEYYSDDEADQDILFKTQYDFACERLVTEEDLVGLDKDDLRIMRNWIFARHGYIFKSQDLKDYFEMLPWYNPRYTDVSSMLSNIEKKNIEFIKRYE